MDKQHYLAKVDLLDTLTLGGVKMDYEVAVQAVRRRWRSPYRLEFMRMKDIQPAITLDQFKRNRRDLQER